MDQEPPQAAAEQVFEDVVCRRCPTLCDNLVVRVEDGRVVDVQPECCTWTKWAFTDDLFGGPEALVDGAPAPLDSALDRTASLLRASHAPVVFGLRESTVEAAREAVGLADRVGARVILARPPSMDRRVAAFQNRGWVGATLGEVRQRADVVVFWRVDAPLNAPALWSRHAVLPRGRFVPEGRAGRTVMVFDRERGNNAWDEADLSVGLDDGCDYEVLYKLRWLVRGRAPGGMPQALVDAADRLKKARYGALFFQEDRSRECASSADWEAATDLVRELNNVTRFVQIGTGEATAEAVLTWQAGFPQGVDFGGDGPAPLDGETSLDEILAAGRADLIVCLGDGGCSKLDSNPSANVHAIPVVRIGRDAADASPAAILNRGVAAVAITTADPQRSTRGTVMRRDGVTLPLTPVLPSRYPAEAEVIRRLRERLGEATS